MNFPLLYYGELCDDYMLRIQKLTYSSILMKQGGVGACVGTCITSWAAIFLGPHIGTSTFDVDPFIEVRPGLLRVGTYPYQVVAF